MEIYCPNILCKTTSSLSYDFVKTRKYYAFSNMLYKNEMFSLPRAVKNNLSVSLYKKAIDFVVDYKSIYSNNSLATITVKRH